MRKCSVLVIAIGLALFLGIVSCSPNNQPSITPSSLPTVPSGQPTLAALLPKSITPEEAAWAKVVEAAKKEESLTIYSYNLVGDIGLAVSKTFKERYHVRLDIVTGRGAEFNERIKVERRMGQVVGDMTTGSSLQVKNMKNAGLTIGVASELPVFREKDVWVGDIFAVDPQDKHVVAFSFSGYTPWINTKIVKPGEEPKVWKDFLNPKFKGQLMLPDPVTNAGMNLIFVPLMREKVIDVDYIKDLYKQDLLFTRTTNDEAGFLSRGERSISVRGTSSEFARFAAEGAPVKAIALEDGIVVGPVTTSVFEGAPHPNAAKVFTNWFLSQEGQTVYGKAASLDSVRKDVTNFLPDAARITPRRLIVMNADDNERAAQLFLDRWLAKLWGLGR